MTTEDETGKSAPRQPTGPRRAIEVVPDAGAMASRAAEWLVEQLAHAIAKRERAVIALSGGSTPKAVFALLARTPFRERVDWEKVDVFWGDERFVHAGDEDRNETMARRALLDIIDLPAAHVYAMPADEGPDYAHSSDDLDAAFARATSAASLHETSLHAFYGGQTLSGERPFFDVVMLGLGEDGHTASLFPGLPQVDERTHWVLPVRTDAKPPPIRITMTLPLLESTHALLFLAAGEGKRVIARRALAGDESLPAGRVHPLGGTLWILDEAAVDPELRAQR
jgi:6-phosphogluconolactonase